MTGMKILITGAGGFIGRRIVDEARDNGHQAIAVVRNPEAAPKSWLSDSGIKIARIDLTAADAQYQLAKLLPEVDAIIHAAAIMTGDPDYQIRETIGATDAILAAMNSSETLPRVVLVSSLSVYDGQALKVGDLLTEVSPLEANPLARDSYCRGKLAQETRVRAAAETEGFELWIMRPGAVFGPGRLWNGHLGHPCGPALIQMESGGQVPISYVDHTAQALVLAASTSADGVEVVNVIDDDLPDRSAYVTALQSGGWPRFVLPLNWRLLNAFGHLLSGVPGLGQRLPGLLRPAVIQARMKPVSYNNSHLRARLDVPPQSPFAEVMASAQAKEKDSTP